jgi:hypothetical protein
MFLNTLFSSLTTTVIGIFDQDINSSLSMMFPQIYLKGIRQENYTNARFWVYLGHAVYQSIVCYYGVYYLFNDTAFHIGGHHIDFPVSSNVLGTACIIILNAFSTCNWNTWNWMTHAAFWGSVIPFFVYVAIYGSTPDSPAYGAYETIFNQPSFYCILLLIIFVSLVPRLIIKYVQRELAPTDTDILQEIQNFYWQEGIDYVHLSKIINGIAQPSSHQSSVASHMYPDTPPHGADGKKTPQLQIETGADGFGIDLTPPTLPPPVPPISGKGQRIQTLKRNTSIDQKSMGDRSRTSSSISLAFKSGVHMASQFVKKFTHDREKDKFTRGSSSLFFMGTHEEIPNTGFAFSHESGMASLITPFRPTLPVLDEEGSYKQRERTATAGSRFSEKASKQMRNISQSIKSVLRINQGRPSETLSNNSNSLRSVANNIPEDNEEQAKEKRQKSSNAL